jgi:hypothetical protein
VSDCDERGTSEEHRANNVQMTTLHLTMPATAGRAVWAALAGPDTRAACALGPDEVPDGRPVRLAGAWLRDTELGVGDSERLCPGAAEAVSARLRALGASEVRVVLDVRRQDRLMEHAHLQLIQAGGTGEFAEQFPASAVLDWAALAERVAAVPGVAEVVLRPVEEFGERPVALAADLLRTAGITGLTTEEAPAPLTYTARGLVVARAMNAHLVSEEECALAREFVGDLLPGPSAGNLFLEPDARSAILSGHAEANRKMFRTWLPDRPEDGYLTDQGTAALAARNEREHG